jgi:prevent-host-death family protein
MKTWQLQEAKARFSEVVQQALTKGPQQVTLHKAPAVVIISIKDYESMVAPKLSFVDFMAQSPLKGVDIEFTRDKSLSREIEL